MSVTYLLLTIWIFAASNCEAMYSNAINLTHIVSVETTIPWPTTPGFEFNIEYRGYVLSDEGEVKFYYEKNNYAQAEHSGTHLAFGCSGSLFS